MAKRTFWISLILLAATFAVVQSLHIGKDVVVLKKNLDRLPHTIGGMQAIDIPLDEAVVKELDTDVYLFRDYASKDGRIVNVYVGYYGTRKGGRSDHNPDSCYPGAGWSILKEGEAEIPVAHGGLKYQAILNTIHVKKGDEDQLVYHWYQTGKSTIIRTGVQQNINRFTSRLLHNRDDGAFVRVSEVVGSDPARTREHVEGFIRQLIPLLMDYWPEERELAEQERM